MDPQEFPHWRAFINACFALFVLLVIGEVFFPGEFEHYAGGANLAIIELLLSLILLSDIAISFVKTKEAERAAFLKKNAIRIIAVLPWGIFFNALSLLRIEAELPLLSEFMVAERTAVAGRGFRLAVKAKELFGKF